LKDPAKPGVITKSRLVKVMAAIMRIVTLMTAVTVMMMI